MRQKLEDSNLTLKTIGTYTHEYTSNINLFYLNNFTGSVILFRVVSKEAANNSLAKALSAETTGPKPASGESQSVASPLSSEKRISLLIDNNRGLNILLEKLEQDKEERKEAIFNFLNIPYGPKDEIFGSVDSLTDNEKISLLREAIKNQEESIR